ncbi:MAG: hypothetical protein OEU26_23675 [Candidatus Tectomicrobia bacterium]|nr:hypothetical protein [Candidatus Tectomicrobia bacterium]
MTDKQAEQRLRALLKMTTDRGTTPAEQANATRCIGKLLQDFPNLRHIIEEVADQANQAHISHQTQPSSGHRSFWKGVVIGVASTALALGAVILSSKRRGMGS